MAEQWRDKGKMGADGALSGSPRPMGADGAEEPQDDAGRQDADGAVTGSPRPTGADGVADADVVDDDETDE
jgi:hypothetical protein